MGKPLRSDGERRVRAGLERRGRAAYRGLVEYRLWRDGEETSAEVELWDGLRLEEAAARREGDEDIRLLATVDARERTLAALRDLLGRPRLRRFTVEELTKANTEPLEEKR
jgi:hypothetical protein